MHRDGGTHPGLPVLPSSPQPSAACTRPRGACWTAPSAGRDCGLRGSPCHFPAKTNAHPLGKALVVPERAHFLTRSSWPGTACRRQRQRYRVPDDLMTLLEGRNATGPQRRPCIGGGKKMLLCGCFAVAHPPSRRRVRAACLGAGSGALRKAHPAPPRGGA